MPCPWSTTNPVTSKSTADRRSTPQTAADERQGVPILADRAYIGAGSWVTTPIRRLPHQDLTATQRTINRTLSAARAPVERSVARLKSWRVFRRARCSPHRMTVIAAAVLTLERQC
ncbi:transposase family protein [Streptomyces scabiei]|uniref:transposase family protein n=1 Tax=Streptomyces scabiei TaxID=1930 RepID=UPI002D21CD50|nr:transposase family protein [Streptomyces scabiei]